MEKCSHHHFVRTSSSGSSSFHWIEKLSIVSLRLVTLILSIVLPFKFPQTPYRWHSPWPRVPYPKRIGTKFPSSIVIFIPYIYWICLIVIVVLSYKGASSFQMHTGDKNSVRFHQTSPLLHFLQRNMARKTETFSVTSLLCCCVYSICLYLSLELLED